MTTLHFEEEPMNESYYSLVEIIKAAADSVELHLQFAEDARIYIYVSAHEHDGYEVQLPIRPMATHHDVRLTNVAGKYIWVITDQRPVCASCIN